VSAVVYIVACRSLDTDEDRRLARAADIGLDPDAPQSSRFRGRDGSSKFELGPGVEAEMIDRHDAGQAPQLRP
jgi:hypothetical protein